MQIAVALAGLSVTRQGVRGVQKSPLFWLAFTCTKFMLYLMFIFWVAFSFVCDHDRFRTPFRKVWLRACLAIDRLHIIKLQIIRTVAEMSTSIIMLTANQ